MSYPPELPESIVQYFDRLEADEFEAAAAQFTEDCEYYHPPSYQGETLVEGRENLLEYFAEERGPKDIDHVVQRVVRDGDSVAFVATQTGEDTGDDYFISFAELEGDEIAYYMAGFLKGETVSY